VFENVSIFPIHFKDEDTYSLFYCHLKPYTQHYLWKPKSVDFKNEILEKMVFTHTHTHTQN